MSSTRPNYFVVGAARSGTTSLTEMLRTHPDVFMTSPKEPHFLAFAGQRVHFTGPGDEVTVNRIACTELDGYLDLYRGAHRFAARGDGSVSTLYYGERAIEVIERHFPDAKILAILRDPVDRAFSSFQFLRSRGFETCPDFESALDCEEERIDAGWHHLWHYAGMGFYGRQLEPFVSALGRERVKILSFDELERDPSSLLAEVCEFLGVAPQPCSSSERVNASGEPRNASVHRAFAALERSGAARRVVGSLVPRRARDWVRGRNLERVAPSENAKARLRAQYRADAASLERLFEGAAPTWVSETPLGVAQSECLS